MPTSSTSRRSSTGWTRAGGEKPRGDDDEIDDWERERERDERPRRKSNDLHPRELTKVMIALRQHEKRGCVHAHTSSPHADLS